jgi:hypothetical protein
LNFLWWDFEMSHEYKLKLGTLEWRESKNQKMDEDKHELLYANA